MQFMACVIIESLTMANETVMYVYTGNDTIVHQLSRLGSGSISQYPGLWV